MTGVCVWGGSFNISPLTYHPTHMHSHTLSHIPACTNSNTYPIMHTLRHPSQPHRLPYTSSRQSPFTTLSTLSQLPLPLSSFLPHPLSSLSHLISSHLILSSPFSPSHSFLSITSPPPYSPTAQGSLEKSVTAAWQNAHRRHQQQQYHSKAPNHHQPSVNSVSSLASSALTSFLTGWYHLPLFASLPDRLPNAFKQLVWRRCSIHDGPGLGQGTASGQGLGPGTAAGQGQGLASGSGLDVDAAIRNMIQVKGG